ncbi:MAG TPA: hypothetical protein DC054_00055 [Blastocatellia bacterium]|nr:hypothetical protein [Blastocatellia bacterium]
MTEAAKLRQDLMDKYQEKEVNVNLPSSVFLTISFVDSALNQEDADKRAARAQDAAKFVVKSLPSIGKIKTIWIMFVATERRWIVFHYHRSLNEYTFNNRGEPIATIRMNTSDDLLSPIVRFNPTSNETDISVTRVQLEGDLNHGIALVPHFTASGNAGDPNAKVMAPAFVVFDFASYADRRIFSSDSDLEIISDGQTDFSGKAHLLSPDLARASNNAQFLTAQIPFEQFAKMGAARSLKVKLNGRQFDVSPEAIAALRRMAAYAMPPVRRL